MRPRGELANEGSEMLIKAVWEICKVNSGSSSEKAGSHSGIIDDLRLRCRSVTGHRSFKNRTLVRNVGTTETTRRRFSAELSPQSVSTNS